MSEPQSEVPREHHSLSSLDDEVTEGLYIASAAVRLSLKNRILVDILAENEDFTPDAYVDVARETLLDLAREAEGEATRLDEVKAVARKRRRREPGMHSYRKADLGNLDKRQEQTTAVAEELRARARDVDALGELVEAAHSAAWAEVSRNIQHNLKTEYATVPEDEVGSEDRQLRINAVGRVDLRELEREVNARARREAREARRRASGVSAAAPETQTKRGENALKRLLRRLSPGRNK